MYFLKISTTISENDLKYNTSKQTQKFLRFLVSKKYIHMKKNLKIFFFKLLKYGQ